MNNITIDLNDMITNIFSDCPKDPKSIHLSFDITDEYELFKILVNILTNGMKILYGDDNNKVDINKITAENFNNIKKYFNSFGFIIKYKYEIPLEKITIDDTIPSDSHVYTDNSGSNNTKLHLYYFTLKTDTIKYEITFDYLVI
jgi:hypothetical protein